MQQASTVHEKLNQLTSQGQLRTKFLKHTATYTKFLKASISENLAMSNIIKVEKHVCT